jgi:N-methylhydantoinase A
VEETEIVTLRVRAVGRSAAPAWVASRGTGRPRARAGRQVWRAGRGHERYRVYERENLGEGTALAGPAVVEQDDSTILLERGWTLTVGAAGSAVLENRGRR